jgi:hypothetical protein
MIMKTASSIKATRFICTSIFCVGISFASSIHADVGDTSFIIDLNSKKATDIGSLGGGVTEAGGINDLGQVVEKIGKFWKWRKIWPQ